jgi:hypothetical protein
MRRRRHWGKIDHGGRLGWPRRAGVGRRSPGRRQRSLLKRRGRPARARLLGRRRRRFRPSSESRWGTTTGMVKNRRRCFCKIAFSFHFSLGLPRFRPVATARHASPPLPIPIQTTIVRDLLSAPSAAPGSTEKCHLFINFLKFINIDEYVQIIFIGFRTDEYNIIFIDLIRN